MHYLLTLNKLWTVGNFHESTWAIIAFLLQDFITVSFLEACSNTKTLGVDPNTTARDLSAQCAEKFEVLDPDSYCLSVLVDGHYQPLAPEELPLAIKSSLHRGEPRKEYYFVYKHGRWPEQEPDKQRTCTPEPTPAPQEGSLIWRNYKKPISLVD